jgi:hypothetical protein
MKYEHPEWYMTTQEFADLIVLTLEENDYFKSNEKAHPQDIEYMFSIIGKAIAQGVSYVGTKSSQKNTQNKNALLTPKNLLK